jgi:regulator of protease activity HflC (stomatin/prohibitin superfamily)
MLETMLGLAVTAATVLALFYGAAYVFFRGREGALPFPRPYVIVHEWQRGVVYRGGRFQRVAPPGRVWTFWLDDVAVVPVEEQMLTIEPRELITADHNLVIVGATVLYTVADPRLVLEASQDSRAAFLAESLGALQAFVAARTLLALLDDRKHIDAFLHSVIAPLATARGFALKEVIVRDITAPADALNAIGGGAPSEPDPFQKH